MRILYPSIRNPSYYDRNPLPKGENYNATVAPHGWTKRIDYTVPAGKKAILHEIQCSISRATVATTMGYTSVGVDITTGAIVPQVLNVDVLNNVLGSLAHSNPTPNLLMVEGDVLEIFTQDLCTGGTIHFMISTLITEFDA